MNEETSRIKIKRLIDAIKSLNLHIDNKIIYNLLIKINEKALKSKLSQ